MPRCFHTKEEGWWLNDARGIPVAHVCERCIDDIKAKYRPEIFEDSHYHADEPIDEDDY